MYAVIFRAEVRELDAEYSEMAMRMRELAMNEYGCSGFHSVTEGQLEVAISYWPNLESIQAWKQNPEHQRVQGLGKSKWYSTYNVQVVEVLREYGA